MASSAKPKTGANRRQLFFQKKSNHQGHKEHKEKHIKRRANEAWNLLPRTSSCVFFVFFVPFVVQFLLAVRPGRP
jgi:hypothetical protein